MIAVEQRLLLFRWFLWAYRIALELDRPRVSDRARIILEAVDGDAAGELANELLATVNRRTDCGLATGILAFGIALSTGLKQFDALSPDVAEEMRLAAAEVITNAIATFGRFN